MSVEYYEFDVNVIHHGKLKLAAMSYENACEIANGLMDKLLDFGVCDCLYGRERIGAEAYDMNGVEVYRKGEI